jgi:aryl-alcohol dehydrogenase-like predicted oxidoreductase
MEWFPDRRAVLAALGAGRLDQLTEALGAINVTLTKEDLAAIETAAPKGVAAGEHDARAGMMLHDSERAQPP